MQKCKTTENSRIKKPSYLSLIKNFKSLRKEKEIEREREGKGRKREN